MSAPLSRGQKIYLSKQAGKAWALAKARGEAVPDCGCGVNGKVKAAKAYRHNQVIAACGRHGLTCATQDQYADIKGHFQNLLGEPGRAFKSLVHGATNARRVVEWKIVRRCQEYGIPLTKAEGICRQMTRGMGLEDADVSTLWNVFFKLRYYE